MARRRRKRRIGPRRILTQRRIGSALGSFLALAAYAWIGEPLRRAIWPEGSFEGRVAYVVDGDTFHVAGVDPAIRLWGVDAPEKGADGYFEAGTALAGFVRGQILFCDVVDRDRYGRAVARCRRKDGEDISALMINSGAAEEYFRYTQGRYAIERWARGMGM